MKYIFKLLLRWLSPIVKNVSATIHVVVNYFMTEKIYVLHIADLK